MTEGPYFSVVVPTFNRAESLQSTLKSILNQSFKNLEVIVVDDGSEDNTEEVVKRFNDPRLIYIKKQNGGPLLARARGADEARGHWIAFCDSDDLWPNNYLELLHKTISNFRIDTIFCDYKVQGERRSRVSELERGGFFKGLVSTKTEEVCILDRKTFFRKLLNVQPIMISAFAIKRSFYEKIGGIHKDLKVIGSEDSHLTLRASAIGVTAYTSKCLVDIGRGEDNVSANFIRNLEGGTKILESILDSGHLPIYFENDLKKAIDRQFLEIAEQYYWQRDLKSALRNLNKTKVAQGRLVRKLRLLFLLALRRLQNVDRIWGAFR